MTQQKTCYIIGPIGDADTLEREWANFVREHIIEPAVTACGYQKPARADDPDRGLITQDIIQQMFEADLVVADLTDHNGNVYYELGIRHCVQKPVIPIIKEGQLPLFDLGTNKAIFIGEGHLIVTKAIEDMKSRIKAIEQTPGEFYSHVHMHIKLKQLKIFEKSDVNIKEFIIPIFEGMLILQSTITDNVKMLVDELVIKPKALKTHYPIPTLPVLELMTREWMKQDSSLAEWYRELIKKELEGDKEVSPPPEDKK